jgi:heme exporter protein D
MTVGEFFSQGGYAFFVWTAYGVTAALLAIEIIQLRRNSRTIRARLRRLLRMRADGGGVSHESQT